MDSKERKELIINGDMYKVIITLSVPIMINSLIQTLYNLVDGMWVSKIGSVEFAATSFVWPVNFLFIAIGMGISVAGTAILSRLIGSGKLDEANKYASQIIALSLITGVIFAVIGFFSAPWIVKFMGAKGELAKHSITFLSLTFFDTPFVFLYFSFNSMMVAQGNTIIPTVLSAISAILNAILDPIFIFTFDLGVAGAAIATVLSKALLVMGAIWVIKGKKSIIKPCFKKFKFDKPILNHIIRIGLPSAVGQSGSALGFILLNSFIASYGNATIAAFAMVNRITSLIMQPAMGVGAALTTIIGQNLGANKMDRVHDGFKKSMIFTITFSIVGCILLLIWDKPIINFFMRSKDDMQVIYEGITYLKYISFSMPLMGIFSVLQGIFQGSGHTEYSMSMEIGRLWFVRIPMILIFKHLTDIGSVGIWFSMSFSNFIICVYGYIVYRKGKWRNNVIKVKESIA